MLSIDITDTELRILSADVSGEKVKVQRAVKCDLAPNTVENGVIKDMHMLAGEITRILTEEKIPFQKTVFCINSGATLYKELLLPKPKKINPIVLEDMIMIDMGISGAYNITYSIVNEEVNEGVSKIKVIATACPQDIVDSYMLLAKQTGLRLSKILVSSDAVSRIIERKPKDETRSPFLLLQVDKKFITINIYANNGLVTSRFIAIDPTDYEEGADSLGMAIFDNIFRIIHFFNSDANSEPIKFISYYGHYDDNNHIEGILEQFNLPYSEVERPFEVSYTVKFKHSAFFTNIASLYKTNPKLHNNNLMDSRESREIQKTKDFWIAMSIIASVMVCAVAGLTTYTGILASIRGSNLSSLEAEYAQLDHDNLKAKVEAKRAALDTFRVFVEQVENAQAIVKFQSIMTPDIITKLKEVKRPGMVIVGDVMVAESEVEVTFTCTKESDPTSYTEALMNQGYFVNISYNGYSVNEEGKYEFTLKMELKGGNVFEA